jgi:PTS system mannose-specific IIA component
MQAAGRRRPAQLVEAAHATCRERVMRTACLWRDDPGEAPAPEGTDAKRRCIRMIGLVIVTHGRLAEEMRAAMEHVVGPQAAVATVCIFPDDLMETRREDIRASIDAVDQGDGVVVLTDILGGTPSNLAFQLCDHRRVEVIAGVNLPLLVKLAKIRGTEPLAEAVGHATAAGRKYIACGAEMPELPKPASVTPIADARAPKSAAGGRS